MQVKIDNALVLTKSLHKQSRLLFRLQRTLRGPQASAIVFYYFADDLEWAGLNFEDAKRTQEFAWMRTPADVCGPRPFARSGVRRP